MRFSFRNESRIYRRRGLGLWWEYGSIGSTYGEPGKDMYFRLTFLFLFWEISFGAGWKKLSQEERDNASK